MPLLDQFPHLKFDKNGVLKIEETAYTEIISKYKTPVLVFSKKRIIENCERFLKISKEFSHSIEVFYSCKTNPLSGICEIIRDTGVGIEVASPMELKEAISLKFPPEKIVLDGPYKPTELIDAAVSAGIRIINVDSVSEILKIAQIAQEKGVYQQIGLTIHPSPNSKLGIIPSPDILKEISKILSSFDSIKLSGVHFHIGTQKIIDLPRYYSKLKEFMEIFTMIEDFFSINLDVINLGGGFPEASVLGVKFTELIGGIIAEVRKYTSTSKIFFEPGRYIVGDAGILLTKVFKLKEKGGIHYLFLDSGINILPKLSKSNYKFIKADDSSEKYSAPFRLVGPTPADMDVINREYFLPHSVKEGDIIAVVNCGAYTIPLSTSLCFPKPPVLLVDGSNVDVISL
ncbi:MAG: diaminopimelate decarboxylase family protein [Candidatus Odinarchaeia archaeon]